VPLLTFAYCGSLLERCITMLFVSISRRRSKKHLHTAMTAMPVVMMTIPEWIIADHLAVTATHPVCVHC